MGRKAADESTLVKEHQIEPKKLIFQKKWIIGEQSFQKEDQEPFKVPGSGDKDVKKDQVMDQNDEKKPSIIDTHHTSVTQDKSLLDRRVNGHLTEPTKDSTERVINTHEPSNQY